MARADLLYELIKYGLVNDAVSFRKAAEAICAEERSKQHTVLANKIEEMLKDNKRPMQREPINRPTLAVGNSNTRRHRAWFIPLNYLIHLFSALKSSKTLLILF